MLVYIKSLLDYARVIGPIIRNRICGHKEKRAKRIYHIFLKSRRGVKFGRDVWRLFSPSALLKAG